MSHLNVEIKAYYSDLARAQQILIQNNAIYQGAVNQVDTYFNCSNGRLKLREADDEVRLIHYQREDYKGPKQSVVTFYQPVDRSGLKEILTRSLGILVVVSKQREVYWIDNIKFHLDRVDQLGNFVEIEAIDYEGTIGFDTLNQQCETYLNALNIQEAQLIRNSYSDLLLACH